MGATINVFGLRKDRTEFPVDIMLKPMETRDGLVTLSFVRDATGKGGDGNGTAARRAAAADC
jgi:protein-histidine pros-kinase